MREPEKPRYTFFLALLALLATACDDTFVDPFENEEHFYTVWGYLDETKAYVPNAMQVLRVIPVTRTAEWITSPFDSQAEIDAFVTTTNLETGQTVVWNHELEQLENGLYGHIFKASFFINKGYTYRLDIKRNDGTIASAVTTIPFIPSVQPTLFDPVVDPETGNVTQEAYVDQLYSPWEMTVIYHNGDPSCFNSTAIEVPYGRVGEPADNGWRFTINLSEDVRSIEENLESINVCAMGMKIKMLDDQWTPPEGVFDPEVLAQPGVLSNVENGYGFFGSIGLYQQDWTVTDALRDLIQHD
jgi:hypothetical protein